MKDLARKTVSGQRKRQQKKAEKALVAQYGPEVIVRMNEMKKSAVEPQGRRVANEILLP